MGNKNAFEILNENLENGMIDPALEFLCILPIVHMLEKGLRLPLPNGGLNAKIAIPSYRWIAFLSYDAKCGCSTLYKARLHSPVDKISSIGKNLKAKEIHCAESIIFLTSDSSPIKAIKFTESSICMLSKEKKKDDLVKLARKPNISHGTVAEITSRLNIRKVSNVNIQVTMWEMTKFTCGTEKCSLPLRPCGNGEELSLFAGSDKEDGSTDGPVKESCFKQPVGICTEFDSVVYVCDAQTNTIKICSKLKECAHFLKAIGCLYQAFSVHNKKLQRTVHQETTMARHGTLPEFMYQRQCEISEKPVSITFDKHDTHAVIEHELEEDQVDKFGESSDEEVVNDDSSEPTTATH
ncbi:Hypothetical predicted protein [Paramuricea clavata]|uniref:Uncharacterized protein n=1 Tax=Paramuricea clavata TaxID=317549 RepID=A0A6S7HLN8_PARCT|nr:Hypothetical predicted protein [Paramuricea clavata]